MQGHISFAKNAMHKSLATTATQRQKKRGTGGVTMAEYIEREEAIEAIRAYNGFFQDQISTENMMLKLEAENVINDLEVADVVEVVRCKDCKWHDSVDGPMRQCDITDDDDFCSYGEREDKQNET